MLHIHISFTHHQNHTILANASVIQKSLPPNNETASLVSKHFSYSVMKHILMKGFHYSRWHSNLYLFVFFCASQTDWQRQEVCCGIPSPILKTKPNTRHMWDSQGGMKIADNWNVRSRGLGKSYRRFEKKTYFLHDGKFYQTAQALSYKMTTFNQDQCSCHDVDWHKISEVDSIQKTTTILLWSCEVQSV